MTLTNDAIAAIIAHENVIPKSKKPLDGPQDPLEDKYVLALLDRLLFWIRSLDAPEDLDNAMPLLWAWYNAHASHRANWVDVQDIYEELVHGGWQRFALIPQAIRAGPSFDASHAFPGETERHRELRRLVDGVRALSEEYHAPRGEKVFCIPQRDAGMIRLAGGSRDIPTPDCLNSSGRRGLLTLERASILIPSGKGSPDASKSSSNSYAYRTPGY